MQVSLGNTVVPPAQAPVAVPQHNGSFHEFQYHFHIWKHVEKKTRQMVEVRFFKKNITLLR